jgi:tRNA (guanine-N7-)-methyltransferase
MRTIHSFVLRGGRETEAQKRAYEELAPKWSLPSGDCVLDFEAAFGNANPVTVEIGFGMGTATACIAEANPERNYLGLEVHKPGIGRLLWEIEKRGLKNIRILEADAACVFESRIPRASLAGVHIFFPDPWPKKKHHKRRLVTRPFTDTLAASLALPSEGGKGGYLYMATDWEDYADWAMTELSATRGLVNRYADSPGGFAPHQEWRPVTKFEAKGMKAGREIRELYFERSAVNGE